MISSSSWLVMRKGSLSVPLPEGTEAAEAAGKDAPETDPHFYMAKAHLFHALQVEKSKR